jgi:hypothetical protein
MSEEFRNFAAENLKRKQNEENPLDYLCPGASDVSTGKEQGH